MIPAETKYNGKAAESGIINRNTGLIINWSEGNVPGARIFNERDEEMPVHVIACNPLTGWMRCLVCGADGEPLCDAASWDIAQYEFVTWAPLRIEWDDLEVGRAFIEKKYQELRDATS